MLTHRSLLFVPGNRPERFAKAASAGADLVCIDLEDAVGLDAKDDARDATVAYLKNAPAHVGVRTNAATSELGLADLRALIGLDLPFVMLPKVEGEGDLTAAEGIVLAPLMPVIESAKSLVACNRIMAHPRVGMVQFGAVDLSADLDCEMSWEALLYARSKLSASARAHDVLLFDVPHLNPKDPDDCEATTRRAKALGIPARAAIHPAQIAPIHTALAPTAEQLDHARKVVAASDASGGDVAIIDGQLIEAPLVRRARALLSQNRT